MSIRDRIWLFLLVLSLVVVLIASSYVNRRDKSIRLHLAASSGSVEEVRMLIEGGSNLEAREGNGTPLLAATLEGHLEVVEILIEAGANPRAAVLDGSPLVDWAAAKAPSAAFLKVLDAADAFDPNGTVQGEALLYHRLRSRGRKSIFYGLDDDIPSIKRLLEEGADPNSTGRNGPLLFVAIENRPPEVVRLLCEAGADPNVRHNAGHYPLHASLTKGVGFAKVLVENGADPTLKDGQGRTPLESARRMRAQYPGLDLINVIEYLEAEQESRN